MIQFIWEAFKYTWWIEYVISILGAFIVFSINLQKRRGFYYKTALCFLFITGVWLFRQIPWYNYDFDILFYFLIYGLLFLTTWLVFVIDPFEAIFIDTLIICTQHLCYKFTFAFVIAFGSHFREELLYFPVEILVSVVIDLLMYFLFSKKLKGIEIKINRLSNIVVTPLVLITTILINSYIQPFLLEQMTNDMLAAELINSYDIIISFAAVAVLFQNIVTNHLKEENSMLELLSKKDKERYELAKITGEEIRIQYHDLKHELAQHKLNQEAQEELKETETNYQSLVYSGSNSLDLILIEKQLLAGKNNCHVNAIVDGSLLSFMKPQHIYSLFSNLLDNAIEASSKMKDEDKRIVKLNVMKAKNNVLISVENYTSSAPKIINGLPETTKENKNRHGYGMKSVKRVVDKYGGIMNIKVENGVFTVKILFDKEQES